MYVIPKDSRQRYTKQCLFDSFLKYLEQKQVSQITVSEVCADAGISRMTFYKYYSDPFVLLKAMQEDLFVGFKQQLQDLPPSFPEIAPVLVRFVMKHKVLFRAIFANCGEGNFLDKSAAYLHDTYCTGWQNADPQMTAEDADFRFRFLFSGMLGVIRHWLVESPKTSADEIIARVNQLLQLSCPSLSCPPGSTD